LKKSALAVFLLPDGAYIFTRVMGLEHQLILQVISLGLFSCELMLDGVYVKIWLSGTGILKATPAL